MWPLPKLRNDIVSLSFTPSHVTCSWIKPTRAAAAPYELIAHERIPLNNLELNQLIVFNPTSLQKKISAFVDKHNLHNASAAIALTGPQLVESIVQLHTTTPTRSDFRAPKLKSMVWDFRYLHPHEDGTNAFYVCGIPQRLLFQYKLFAMQLPLHVLQITTQQMALLRLYRHVHGSAFRPAQLARDMARTNNQLHDCITQEIMRRVVYARTPSLNTQEELPSVATTVGLFLLGKDMYEAY